MIEQLRINDLEQLRDLVSFTVRKCIEADKKDLEFIINDTLNNSEAWLKNPDSGVHLVYKEGNSVKGMVLVKEYWNLASLFVHPSKHGLGVASNLLDSAMKICVAKSVRKSIKLNSSTFAAGFYEKYGFVQVGEARNLPGGCIPFEYSL